MPCPNAPAHQYLVLAACGGEKWRQFRASLALFIDAQRNISHRRGLFGVGGELSRKPSIEGKLTGNYEPALAARIVTGALGARPGV